MLDRTRSATIAAIAATALAAAPVPALALGKKEKGFLMGVAAAIIVDQLVEHNRSARAPAYPTYYVPPATAYPDYTPTYEEPAHRHARPSTCCGSSGTHLGATPAARAFRSYSPYQRRMIQQHLRAQGYYWGAIDGTFGPATYEAVTQFARDRGMRGNLGTTAGAFAVYDCLL